MDTVWGSTTKPESARRLAETLAALDDEKGTLYIGYPIIGTPEGAFPFDALLLSPTRGAIAFDLVEGKELGAYQERQDDLYAKLTSKLLQYPNLMKRRELAAKIEVITFAPSVTIDDSKDDYLVVNSA